MARGPPVRRHADGSAEQDVNGGDGGGGGGERSDAAEAGGGGCGAGGGDATVDGWRADGCSEDEGATLGAQPPLRRQFTLRGAVLGAGCALLFCAITLRLSLGAAGIVPSINAPAGLLSFVVLKLFSKGGQTVGLRHGLFAPLTVQETTVVQTYVTAACNLVFTAGFGTYLTAMSYQAHLNTGGAPRGAPGYDPNAVYDPTPSRVLPFVLVTSFVGAFAIVALRKLIIVDWQLPFPSGVAAGIMLNSFFSAPGQAIAARKVRVLLWTAVASFAFELFKWPWQGSDYSCGFSAWPTFGFTAFKWTWFFDWNESYIGSGMIIPHSVDWSMMLGAIISWGAMWPALKHREGDWFPASLGSRDPAGLFGYKVFLTIAITMGEGVYMLGHAAVAMWRDARQRLVGARAAPRLRGGAAPSAGGRPLIDGEEGPAPGTCVADDDGRGAADGSQRQGEGPADREHLLHFKESPQEHEVRSAVFVHDPIPWWVGPAGYAAVAALCIGLVPLVYPPVRWYYVAVALLMAPVLALPNAYGCGITDWDNASLFAKLALFAFAGWAGGEGEGGSAIISGLGVCGIVLSACSSAAVTMQNLRTGYVTTTSARTMFVAQLVGTLMGCFLAPLAFFLIWATGQVGVKDGPYSNPFADIYRSMAILGSKGFGSLPKHCPLLMGLLFAAAILICGARDALPSRYARFVPSPMAVGIPFYLGANNAINFWLGSLVVLAWERLSPAGAEAYSATAGAGLIIGSGIFAVPSAILTLAGVAPPVCMSFSPEPPKGG